MLAAGLRQAASAEDCAAARALFLEYARSLAVDLCFQGFDHELATLPGAYAPPRGRLLLAGPAGDEYGCIALRSIDREESSDVGDLYSREPIAIGEIKRLYVKPGRRQEGWGRRLAEAAIAEARAIGYVELKLDTFDWMVDARKLYAGLGFRECAPYYANPFSGAIYMSCAL